MNWLYTSQRLELSEPRRLEDHMSVICSEHALIPGGESTAYTRRCSSDLAEEKNLSPSPPSCSVSRFTAVICASTLHRGLGSKMRQGLRAFRFFFLLLQILRVISRFISRVLPCSIGMPGMRSKLSPGSIKRHITSRMRGLSAARRQGKCAASGWQLPSVICHSDLQPGHVCNVNANCKPKYKHARNTHAETLYTRLASVQRKRQSGSGPTCQIYKCSRVTNCSSGRICCEVQPGS